MSKQFQILEVGNCSFDHSRLSQFLNSHWPVKLVRAGGISQAHAALSQQSFDLIIANRVLEGDGRLGMELFEELRRQSPSSPPFVLLTDYPDKQAAALAAGVRASFGKRQIGTPEAAELLGSILSED